MEKRGLGVRDLVTADAIENAMLVHAAFGGSTNLLLHVPAIAHAAGLRRPTVEDWTRVNRRVSRIVDALPNGPRHHPTIQVFLAGGVPEVMLHLRRLGVLHLQALSATGRTWDEELEAWEHSERRERFRALLREQDGVDPDDVIMSPDRARAGGLTSTMVFPRGNLAPEGALIRATSIAPEAVGPDGVYRLEGPVRFFASEREAIAAIKQHRIAAGDVMVLAGRGPMGSGMEETYQLTSALKFLPFGARVALLTDARFSGVSTGACVGHIGPEALAGGPLGKLRDGDRVRVVVDRVGLTGSIDLVGEGAETFAPDEGARRLANRSLNPAVRPDPALPNDTRLWAALQHASGGTWGGCVYDADAIIARLSPAAGR
jgi:putative YjhG/YagF family dehydratase